MIKKENKLLIISLDGATFDIIKPLAEQGFMPNIKMLIDSGVATELMSVDPPITPSAWSSFMTGKHPGRHGVINFRIYDPETNTDRFVTSKSIQSKTIWQILSENNKKIGVINLPMTYPSYEVNGFIISGFDTPSVKSDFTYPKELKNEILSLIPDYDFIFSDNFRFYDQSDFGDFISGILKAFEQRGILAKHLMVKYPWDVFMIHFQNLDNLQHKTWGYVNPNNPNEVNKDRRNSVLECYKRLDEIIGSIIKEAIKHDSTIMVISDHGFGPEYGAIYLNQLLIEWEFLALKRKKEKLESPYSRLKNLFRNSKITFVKEGYDKLYKMKNALKDTLFEDALLEKSKKNFGLEIELIDMDSTKAFVPPCIRYGFVYLNRYHSSLRGNRRECNLLIEHLIDRFSKVKEPYTGEKIFARVVRGEEIYMGSIILPDIVLIPRDGFVASSSLHNSSFITTRQGSRGIHRKNGIFIADGKNIRQPKNDCCYSITDLAPTILAMYGIPIPDDMDGKVLSDIFVNSPKIRFESGDVNYKESRDKDVYSDEDRKKIEERLKGIGYLS